MTHPATTARLAAALAALATLQACAPPQQDVFYDPYEQYALGKVYDCADIPMPDYRLNTENAASPGFGCSHQSNITLMVSDPADLSRPRALSPADERARQRVLQAYREGDDTTTAQDARGTRELIQ